jgi:hypothetical protein
MRQGTIALFTLAMLAASPALAQKSEDVVRWKATGPAGPIKSGTAASIELKAEIDDGWYMYALAQPEGGAPPLEIAIAKGQPFTLDRNRIDAPVPDVTKGTSGEPDTFHYDGKATFTVPVETPTSVKPGKHTVSIEVTYQVCSGSICLRPATTTLPIPLTVR